MTFFDVNVKIFPIRALYQQQMFAKVCYAFRSVDLIFNDNYDRAAQPQTKDPTVYIHSSPASFKSQFLQSVMSVIGIKHRTEKDRDGPEAFLRSYNRLFVRALPI